MNGFTHLKNIRFSDAKANILLRSGTIGREDLINAKDSIIRMRNVHYGVAKRINDTTAIDVQHLGVWYPVVCGDTNRLHEIYCMDDRPAVVVTMDPETYTKHDEDIIDDNQTEVSDDTGSVNNVADVNEDQVSEIVEETIDESEEAIIDDEVMEENTEPEDESVVEEEINEVDATSEQTSEVFVTGMSVEGSDNETVEAPVTTTASTYNNQNQGNARRQVNINQNRNNAKRRHH